MGRKSLGGKHWEITPYYRVLSKALLGSSVADQLIENEYSL